MVKLNCSLHNYDDSLEEIGGGLIIAFSNCTHIAASCKNWFDIVFADVIIDSTWVSIFAVYVDDDFDGIDDDTVCLIVFVIVL